MTQQQGVWTGILLVAGVTATIVGCFWLLFSGLVGRACLRLGRVLHLVPSLPPPDPPNPPLETVVADLRRIRHELDHPVPGLAMAKRRGTLQAYEDRLLDACRALEVPNALAGLEEGIDRDAERLRVEVHLEDAGVVLAQRSH